MNNQVVASQRNKLVIIHEPPLSATWGEFARYVASLLGGETVFRPILAGRDTFEAERLRQATGEGDLNVLQARVPSYVRRALGKTAASRVVDRLAAPVLVAREPRWPFLRLLLILRDDRGDDPAIRWTLRLATSSGAAVTILPVVPSLPIMYAQGARGQPELAVLLAPNTPIGGKIWQVATALVERGIPGIVRQQRGAPDRQIQQETADGD